MTTDLIKSRIASASFRSCFVVGTKASALAGAVLAPRTRTEIHAYSQARLLLRLGTSLWGITAV